jgi:hypothetical protein
VSSPLQYSAASVTAGGQLTGSATIKNLGTASLTVQNVVLASRPPGGTNTGGPYDDFGSVGPITLAGGQSLTITKTRTFTTADPLGSWYGFVTYQTPDGVWQDDPRDATFAVVAPSAAATSTSTPVPPTATSTNTPAPPRATSTAQPPTATPDVSDPGGLVITSPSQLSAPSVARGGSLTASATFSNRSSTTLTVKNSAIAGRPPNGTNNGGPYDDFGGTGQVTLAPGQTISVPSSMRAILCQTGGDAAREVDPASDWPCARRTTCRPLAAARRA